MPIVVHVRDPTGRRDDLLLVIERASSLIEHVDMQSLLEETIDAAMELTDAEFGALGVVNDHGRIIEFHHRGMSPGAAESIGGPPVGRGLLGDITRHGMVVRTDDVTEHAGYSGMPTGHPDMSSFLGVPVKVRGKTFGNLYVTRERFAFDIQDEIAMKAIAAAAGAGIDSIRMSDQLRERAVMADRERIARDVHDSIIQNLFAVGLDLQLRSDGARNDPDLRSALDGAAVAIDASIADLRRLIYDLHDDLPRRGSLTEEMAKLIERLGGPYAVRPELHVNGEIPDLDISIIDDVLQIVREAASNALRHSGSTTIDVTVSADDRSLFLAITDNGHGFDVASAPWGLGLTNMRTRTKRAGGDLSVVSHHDLGTSVEVMLPVPGGSGSG